MQREVVKISELKAAPYNPRQISGEALAGLSKSLERWGVVQEVVANRRTGYIVGGHQRVAALKKMGVREVPVVWVDLDDVEEKALNVALNNPHISGEFDDTIAGLLAEIRDGIGPDDFEALKLDDLLPPDATVVEGNTDPDDVPEVPEEPITKPGDLWVLGDHRLLCGDSTNVQHVERLMDGKKADMVFTDPPYALFGNSTGVVGITDDKMIMPFFRDIFSICRVFVEPFGHIYACCDWHSCNAINKAAKDVTLPAKNLIVWDKGDAGIGGMFMNCHELVWFFTNTPENRNTTKRSVKRGERPVNGISNIWRVKKVPPKQREHNAAKPVELVNIGINASSDKGGIVLDLFGGSGTTLIACEETSRKCCMMEMEPKYCDVIVKRWEDFTGKKAKLEEANDATG